jgi:hypothetical protein
MLEERARDRALVGSLSLLAAASVLTVPFERARDGHFLLRDVDSELVGMMDALKKVKFVVAPFWNGEGPVNWRQTRIVANFNDSDGWIDGQGKHPFATDAENVIAKKDASEVLRVIRNALAHGNIVYLNQRGLEREGEPLHYLALLSRYEETEGQRAASETYRLVAATEEEFLRFVKAWARWIVGAAWSDRDVRAA